MESSCRYRPLVVPVFISIVCLLVAGPARADGPPDRSSALERQRARDELRRALGERGATTQASADGLKETDRSLQNVADAVARGEDKASQMEWDLIDRDAQRVLAHAPNMELLDRVAARLRFRKNSVRILGFGDSLASGEGSPDQPGDYVAIKVDGGYKAAFNIAYHEKRAVKWAEGTDVRRHYSTRNSHELVKNALKKANPSVQIQFKSWATTGAKLADVEAQIVAARKSIAGDAPDKPRVDFVFLSVGSNDVDFVMLVHRLIHHGVPGSNLSCAEIERDFLHGKPNDYSGLALDKCLDAFNHLNTILHENLDVRDQDVYLTAAPDFTSDDRDLASAKDLFDDFWDPERQKYNGSINHDDLEWAREHLIGPLNRKLGESAKSIGWNFVGGIERAFLRHGYGAGPANRWIVTASESRQIQGDQQGTVHPNYTGQIGMAFYMLRAISYNQNAWIAKRAGMDPG